MDVDAPIDLVFDKYAQYERHAEWQTGLLRAELTSGPSVAPGTRGFEVRRLFGREMSFPYVITEHVAPHRSAFQTLQGPLRPAGIASFSAVAGGTRIEFEMDLGARGALRLLSRLLTPLFARQTQADLEGFKAWVETELRTDRS
ncbi:MAG: SRPBCC family protein [Solirubrobacteraceae bacterium]